MQKYTNSRVATPPLESFKILFLEKAVKEMSF